MSDYGNNNNNGCLAPVVAFIIAATAVISFIKFVPNHGDETVPAVTTVPALPPLPVQGAPKLIFK